MFFFLIWLYMLLSLLQKKRHGGSRDTKEMWGLDVQVDS
jgi:hypothetical protein